MLGYVFIQLIVCVTNILMYCDGSTRYGFVSFKDPNDFIKAMREMNGKYVGNRPIKLRKSNWKERNIENVRKKLKEKKKLGYKV